MSAMSSSPCVSIVVPVYNTADYLRECIGSIVAQTYENLEILLIDDGSTDQSLDMINDYAASDKRIRVVSQEHRGVGQARNIGIRKATGKYLICWDSDDAFRKDAVSKLVSKAELTGADVCICNAQSVDAQTGAHKPAEFIRKKYPPNDPFSWEDFPEEVFLVSTVSWNKLVRLAFLRAEDIVFPDGVYEDFIFTVLLMRLAKKITVVRDRLIFYKVNRRNSLTDDANHKSDQRIASHMDAYLELEKRGLLQDERVARSFFSKLAVDYRFFMRFFDSYSEYESFYKSVTSDKSALSFYEKEKYNVPSVNEFFAFNAQEYLFLEFKKQLYDAMRYRQLGIERGITIRELQKNML